MKVILQPYKLRDKKFVELSDPKLELDWEEYKKLIAPTGTKNAFLVARKAKVGNYIGLLSKQNSLPINFIFISPNNSKDAKNLYSQMSDIEDRLLVLYKVEYVDFGTKVQS